jgi:hypothetical protein
MTKGIAMQHDCDFPRPVAVPAAHDLLLMKVLATMADGSPVLAGAQGRQVVAIAPAGPDHCGRMAVCQPFGPNGDKLAVLGYLAETVAAPTDLILSAGKAALHLHADGRVRLTGKDVRVEAAGLMALRGAHVALN